MITRCLPFGEARWACASEAKAIGYPYQATGDGVSDELVTPPLQLPVVGREVDIRQQRRQRATLRLPNRILRLRPGLNP